MATPDISSLSYLLFLLSRSLSLQLSYCYIELHAGTCSLLDAPFLQRSCFWGGFDIRWTNIVP